MKYFSMFSGIGGFELGIQQAIPSAKCVGFSEIDKWAVSIYSKHFKEHKNYGDATKINTSELPDFDILVGGFPCQTFSLAGKRQGFRGPQGTLFFEIVRIIRQKWPRLLVLENVKGLLSNDKGNSAVVIMSTLDELGYNVQWHICNSANYGVPQDRQRVFIVGHLRATSQSSKQIFPLRHNGQKTTRLQGNKSNTLTARYPLALGAGSYIGRSNEVVQLNKTNLKSNNGTKTGLYAVPMLNADRASIRKNVRRFKTGSDSSFTLTAQDRHGVLTDGRIRKFMPVECERLQGFPDGWTEFGSTGGMFNVLISDNQRYKCLGNAVTVNVVVEIFNKLKNNEYIAKLSKE